MESKNSKLKSKITLFPGSLTLPPHRASDSLWGGKMRDPGNEVDHGASKDAKMRSRQRSFSFFNDLVICLQVHCSKDLLFFFSR